MSPPSPPLGRGVAGLAGQQREGGLDDAGRGGDRRRAVVAREPGAVGAAVQHDPGGAAVGHHRLDPHAGLPRRLVDGGQLGDVGDVGGPRQGPVHEQEPVLVAGGPDRLEPLGAGHGRAPQVHQRPTASRSRWSMRAALVRMTLSTMSWGTPAMSSSATASVSGHVESVWG